MKSIVLCAGYGTRLGDLTTSIPKAMLPIGKRPLLEYILRNLKRHNFSEIVINLHFKAETIRGFVGDGSRFGLKVQYSYEENLLGTAGAVKKMERFLRDKASFLVHYGDIVTDQDFGQMLRFHQDRNALTTILLHQRKNSNSVVQLNADNRITDFLERPSDADRQGIESNWVNSGIYICHPDIIDYIPPKQECDFPRDVFTRLVDSGRLWGWPLSGYRCAVDSSKRLAEVRSAVASGRMTIS
jgi:NDP-sugar pyrophosphorylase family protein